MLLCSDLYDVGNSKSSRLRFGSFFFLSEQLAKKDPNNSVSFFLSLTIDKRKAGVKIKPKQKKEPQMRTDKKNKISKRAANYAQDFLSFFHTWVIFTFMYNREKNLRLQIGNFSQFIFRGDNAIVQMLSSSYFWESKAIFFSSVGFLLYSWVFTSQQLWFRWASAHSKDI